ncbi:MAG: mismatch-specific DNA-glycosylase [Microthrixaceae bacterium]
MLLRALHRALREASVEEGSLPGAGRVVIRPPEGLSPVLFGDVAHLCGFEVIGRRSGRWTLQWYETAPSTLGAPMDLLLVGVNPSPTSAQTGVPFGRGGNRFWPAMLEAGLTDVGRDPAHLLRRHRIGMTDFAKIVTRRADEVPPDVLAAGMARLERIVGWFEPAAVAIVGVMAWRTASGDRHATLGLQSEEFAGVPLWLLPNPSGLNAHTNVADMAERLRRAAGR